MRALALLLLLVGEAASADVSMPREVKRAVLGAWDVRDGVTLELTSLGEHSINYAARFHTRPRGGPRVLRASAVWLAREVSIEVPCRPRSQHGSFCRVSPHKDGLRVQVFAIKYRDRTRGHLVADFIAQRVAAQRMPRHAP